MYLFLREGHRFLRPNSLFKRKHSKRDCCGLWGATCGSSTQKKGKGVELVMFNPSRADAGCGKLSTGEDGITGIKRFYLGWGQSHRELRRGRLTEIQDLKVPPRALAWNRQHRSRARYGWKTGTGSDQGLNFPTEEPAGIFLGVPSLSIFLQAFRL